MCKVGPSLCERDKYSSKNIKNSNLPDKQIL